MTQDPQHDPDVETDVPERLNTRTWITLIMFAVFVVVGSGCVLGLWFR